jgi:hypothetical protein
LFYGQISLFLPALVLFIFKQEAAGMGNSQWHKSRTITIFIMLLLIICISGSGCAEKEKTPSGLLVIEGDAVEDKVSFTLDELKSMPEGIVEADYFGINSYGTKGYSHFKGIWIGYILNEKVALKANASRVTIIAEDDYRVEYSLEEIMREDYIDEQNPEARLKIILAWEENGRELKSEMGSPLQLVMGQRHPGDVNKPYWVRYVKTIRID